MMIYPRLDTAGTEGAADVQVVTRLSRDIAELAYRQFDLFVALKQQQICAVRCNMIVHKYFTRT